MLYCEGLFFIFGLVALISGRFRLYGKHTIRGTAARLVGLVAILPITIAAPVGFVLGSTGANSPQVIDALTVIEFGLLVGAFIVALVVTWQTPATE